AVKATDDRKADDGRHQGDPDSQPAVRADPGSRLGHLGVHVRRGPCGSLVDHFLGAGPGTDLGQIVRIDAPNGDLHRWPPGAISRWLQGPNRRPTLSTRELAGEA